MIARQREARRGAAIALVTHSYYEEDPRVRRQAEALAESGWRVEVFALRRPGDTPGSRIAGVEIHHLGVRRHQGAGALTYLAEYVAFFVRVVVALAVGALTRGFDLVQVATLPDWLVFAAAPLRWRGVPVILDLHEAMPEFFASRFPRLAGGPARRLMLLVERASVRFATHALTANDALRARLLRLGVPAERVTSVPNAPSLARFDASRHPDRPFMADGSLRLVYAGALTPTYGLDDAIKAIAAVRDRRPELGIELDLYGRGDAEAGLRDLAASLGVAEMVRFRGRIPLDDVPAAIAAADIGLAPIAMSAFTELSFSTKLLEYGAMRRPIVTARLPVAEEILGGDRVEFYEPGDPAAMAEAILRIVDSPSRRQGLVAAMRARVDQMSWERERLAYEALLERYVRPA